MRTVVAGTPELLPGPHRPVPTTPPRVPGSVRRTTSIDLTRPDGLTGRIVADVRGQDVHTAADGTGHVVQRLALVVEIDPRDGTVITVAEVSADRPGGWEGLRGLVGVNVRRGFGRRIAELLPGERERRSLLYSVLEDLGGAVLVSGYAPLRAGVFEPSPELAEQMALAQGDVCIGWARGGPLLEATRQVGRSPVPIGPIAPVIEGDDPLGWHPMEPMAPHTVRRRRRLDVAVPASPSPPPSGPEALVVQSHFRDSYAGEDGEMVMHEYLIDARVDARRRIAEVEVDPRVLPWGACPGAVPSAQHLVGTPVDEIPARVRAELTGPTTCTHLNSTLRCLADLPALAQLLRHG